jgi:hypothetical protein
MNALDHIYQNQDSTLAYYDHAGCTLGICGRCVGKVNGKPGLICQTPVEGDITVEPLNQERVIKDLVMKKETANHSEETKAESAGMMGPDINSVPIIVRREIEALIAAPLIKSFIEKFGREPALEAAEEVIKSLAHGAGKFLQGVAGGKGMEHLQKVLPLFSQGGALEFEVIRATAAEVAVNVTRCKYAEMYREHGLEEFGALLSCGRDFALMEAFNPKIRFTRTQTIMEGAAFCDFRFSVEEE